MKCKDTNTDTYEGRLLLVAIGYLMNIHPDKTEDQIIKMLCKFERNAAKQGLYAVTMKENKFVAAVAKIFRRLKNESKIM